MPHDSENSRWLRFGGILGALFFIGLFLSYMVAQWHNDVWVQLATKHPVVILGMAVATIGAFTVVAIFRTVEGAIKLKILGLEFEGASGPIVMWIFCLLSLILGIKILMAIPL